MTTSEYQPPAAPVINKLHPRDIGECIGEGISDFFKAPQFGLFFGAVYALGGMLVFAGFLYWGMPWLIFPVAIGFPLVGPFVAVGLYEVSRRIAAKEPLGWSAVLTQVFRQRERELGWMAFVVLFIFWIWMYQVRLLIALFLGFESITTLGAFVDVVTGTLHGIEFLALGTLIGACLATVLFSVSVIAIPLLLERELDIVTAILTSIRTVLMNPVAMLTFAAVVTISALAAMVPYFLGLLIVLPVLGHATWHVYKRAIAPV